MSFAFLGCSPHCLRDCRAQDLTVICQHKKPTRLSWLWVGSVLLEDSLLRFAHPHTHAGLQQQQQIAEVVLGVIVIANLLYRG